MKIRFYPFGERGYIPPAHASTLLERTRFRSGSLVVNRSTRTALLPTRDRDSGYREQATNTLAKPVSTKAKTRWAVARRRSSKGVIRLERVCLSN